MIDKKLTFLASEELEAKEAQYKLRERYRDFGVEKADVVVALGGALRGLDAHHPLPDPKYVPYQLIDMLPPHHRCHEIS